MLYEYLKEHMSRFPDKTLCEGEVCITYRELLDCPPSLLKRLKSRDNIAILCKSPLNVARAIIACLKMRRAIIPLSYQYGKNHIDRKRQIATRLPAHPMGMVK